MDEYLLAQVMTGPLVLDDLPRLDGMIMAFEEVAEDGPDKILRKVDSWWPRSSICKLSLLPFSKQTFTRFKMFLEQDKNKTWQDLDTLENFHVS